VWSRIMNLATLCSFRPGDASHLVAIWNSACGPDLAITQRFVDYNTCPPTGALQAGQLAIENDQPVGFVLASALPNDLQTALPQVGWINAIAVFGNRQKHGIGSALLAWAEDWLRAQGCMRFRLGGSLHPFTPGYPVELGNAAFFVKRGYAERGGEQTWDVARDLGDYATTRPRADATIRPARSGDENTILEFFAREFPGRWRYEFQEFLRERGRLSDYQLLITPRGIDGFARVTLENSERPIDRFYLHRLPHPWGQLGPIGVSTDTRGKGHGGALLDAGLCYLREQAVRGCVIDWTGLVDFYGKFGLKPYRQYSMLIKSS
jgi:predicted N-acetyltransferase YhbS